MTQSIMTVRSVIESDEHRACSITNETSVRMRETSNALTEIYSAVYEQLIICEITALERDDDLVFVIDFTEATDYVSDVRQAFDDREHIASYREHIASFSFSRIESVHAMLRHLALTVDY